MEMNNIRNALFGDGKGKIKTFAIMTGINPADIDITPNGFMWYLRNMGLSCTRAEKQNTFILYNLSYADAAFLAERFGIKSFFLAENQYPAMIAYYEEKSENKYIKADVLENITAPETAEEFISRHGTEIKFTEEYIIESAGKYCDSIINENYSYHIQRATDDSFIPRARVMARRNARHKYEN